MSDNIHLRACMKEIEAVMRKHNAGGYVILADHKGGEYKFINPQWSVYKPMDGARSLFRSRQDNAENVTATVHLLQVVEQASANAFNFSHNLIKQIKNHLTIEGRPKTIDY